VIRERWKGEKLGEFIELLPAASRRLSDDLACSNSSPGPHHGCQVKGDGENYNVRHRYRTTAPKNCRQNNRLKPVDGARLERSHPETPKTLWLPPG